MKTTCNIKLKAFNHCVLEDIYKDLSKEVKEQSDVNISLVRLPTKVSKITLIKSPHVYKKSREQFESRHYARLIKMKGPMQTIQNLVETIFTQQHIAFYSKVEWSSHE